MCQNYSRSGSGGGGKGEGQEGDLRLGRPGTWKQHCSSCLTSDGSVLVLLLRHKPGPYSGGGGGWGVNSPPSEKSSQKFLGLGLPVCGMTMTVDINRPTYYFSRF